MLQDVLDVTQATRIYGKIAEGGGKRIYVFTVVVGNSYRTNIWNGEKFYPSSYVNCVIRQSVFSLSRAVEKLVVGRFKGLGSASDSIDIEALVWEDGRLWCCYPTPIMSMFKTGGFVRDEFGNVIND